MHAKGEDAKLTVMVDGREELVFRSLESVEFDWGLSTEEYNYVGADRVSTDENNGPCRITMRINPDSPGFGRLIELRRARATPLETRSAVRFDLSSVVNFGDAGRDRWAFPDIKLTDGNSGHTGRTARVTGSIVAICDNPKRM